MNRFVLIIVVLAGAGSLSAADEPYRRVVGFRTHGSYVSTTADHGLAFSDDGRWLTAGGSVIDVDRRVMLGPIGSVKTTHKRVLITPDGKRLLAADGMALYEVTDRRDNLPLYPGPQDNPAYKEVDLPVAFIKLKDIPSKCACLSADGKELILYTHNHTAERWSLSGKKIADVTAGFEAQVHRVQPLGNTGKYLLLPEFTRTPALVWDGESPVLDRCPLPEGKRLDSHRLEFAVAPDGASAYELAEFGFGSNGTEWGLFVLTWDLKKRKVVSRDMIKSHEHLAFAHSEGQEHKVGSALLRLPDGRYVVGYGDGHVELRDAGHAIVQDLTAGRLSVLKSKVMRIAASRDHKRIATLDASGVVVLYELGGKALLPGPTPEDYPIALGSRWTYVVEKTPNSAKVVTQATGVEVIGAEPCYRLETHVHGQNAVNMKVTDFYLKSDYVACRKDGLYLVSRFNDNFYILHREGTFDLAVAAVPLTRDNAKARGKEYHEAAAGGRKSRQRFFVREDEEVDTPYQAKMTTTRLDRELDTDGTSRVETVYLAKGVGPVKFYSSKQQTTFVLEAYAPGK